MESVWRKDFAILETVVHGHPLAYLDNAATTPMPRAVCERLASYYAHEHANVHRGVHYLSERATDALERARAHVATFVGAARPEEIVFTSGATDSLNMVASGLGTTLGTGDAVVVSDLEHHSNFVPWQHACTAHGAVFVVWRSQDGKLLLDDLERLLRAHQVKLVAITQVSNVTGTVVPVAQVAALAHRYGALVLVDGAQGVLHQGVDVVRDDIDFYAFSAHKMLGPTGTGVLYGRYDVLQALEPARFGGGMVDEVGDARTTYGALPYRLEAGTPNIAGIVGLDAALCYLEEAELAAMRRHERELLSYLVESLERLEGVRVVGHPERHAALASFVVEGMQAYDVAFMLDKLGVAVRSGHHCAQPALRSLGVDATARASIAPFNDERDVDALCEGLRRVCALLR